MDDERRIGVEPMSRANETTLLVVPQGAEHRAVLNGLSRVAQKNPDSVLPTVMPLPIGPESVSQRLQAFHREQRIPLNAQVMLMGLGGSLVPDLTIGAIALFETCVPDWEPQPVALTSAPALLDWADDRLQQRASRVRGVTSHSVISTACEKALLHQRSGASVVDMEGYSLLQFCQTHGLQGSVLRVISDNCTHDVPNINSAISPDGDLKPLPMMAAFFQKPMGAIRLIRGSLTSLSVLTTVTQQLFEPS
ncbi:MAG: hypothetical protein VKL39_17260 [Leptolyngbyaceae bacterium]|nr:hypothetical protein [Leptolyngbyaceae bacterium]